MSWNAALAAEYTEEVKKFTDEQLYSEYSRVKTSLEKKTDGPFPRRTRRKQRTDRGDSSYRPPFGPSSEPNHHPDKLYCLCQQRDDGRTYMQCNGCHEWYHPECVGLKNNTDRYKNDIWECPKCKKGNQSDTYSPSKSPTPRKKRKGIPDSRDRKRMKSNNHHIRDSFVFPPPGEQRRRKTGKRKRSEFEDDIVPKRVPKSKSKQKKKYTKTTPIYEDEDSESFEDTHYSLSNYGGHNSYGGLHGNQFGNEKMHRLLEDIIKGERRLERIKAQRAYEKEIFKLKSKTNAYEKKANNELEDLEDMKVENETLKNQLHTASEELRSLREYQMTAKERHTKRTKKMQDSLNKTIAEQGSRIRQLEGALTKYESEEDRYQQKYILENSLKEMEEDRDKALVQLKNLGAQYTQTSNDLQRASDELQMARDKINELMDLNNNNNPKNKLSADLVSSREYQELMAKCNAFRKQYENEKRYNESADKKNKELAHELNQYRNADFAGNRTSLDKSRKLKSTVEALTEQLKALQEQNSQLRSESRIKINPSLKSENKPRKKKNRKKQSNPHSNTLPKSNSKTPLQENTTIQAEYNMKPSTRKHNLKCRLCHSNSIARYRMLVCARGIDCEGGSGTTDPGPVAYHTRCSKKKEKEGLINGKWHCRACFAHMKENKIKVKEEPTVAL